MEGLVELFLEVFKKACEKHCFYFVPRDKNMAFLASKGITKNQAIAELCKKLGRNHYFKGPEPDKDKEGDVWIFKITLFDVEVYVKLKAISDKYCIKCLSLHD